MSNIDINLIREKAETWLTEDFDDLTKKEVRTILEGDEKILIDSFYKDLEFGTGGLRGIMGSGTNRMNRYTIGLATQGLSNYIRRTSASNEIISVAIAHDCRHNSRHFAEITAEIFSSNGFKVYLFDDLRPTPELSFAIRQLGCKGGVVITASHNPPEYNGYKAYWDDGGQVTAPHDKAIIDELRKLQISDIKFDAIKENIEILDNSIDDLFIQTGLQYSLNPDINRIHSNIGIVYTPIHGTGVRLIPEALKAYGFTNIINVPEQDIIDGDFPTVESPNPEEPAAFDMAIRRALEKDAVLVMASDPDGDRIGAAVKNRQGKYVLLNGNQTGILLSWYIISQTKEKKLLNSDDYIIKTIVTSELFDKVAIENGVECFNVLTGFKYFASLIRILEKEGRKYLGGGEESFGFLPGDYVRDKDAVASCALLAEVAAYAESLGKNLFELLIDIYSEYGLYKERLKYVIRKGIDGADQIRKMMISYREKPPLIIAGSKVIRINDYQKLESKDMISGQLSKLDLDISNVLQFFLEDGSKISVRPSGTEPKIKFYFSVNTILNNPSDFEDEEQRLENRIDEIIIDLDLA